MAGAIISQVAEQLPNKVAKLVYVAAYLPANGETINGITNTFLNNKPMEIFEFNKDYTLVSIKKDALVNAVCADCPPEIKAALVKYHRAEPVQPLNDKVRLTANFNAIPKYFITTTNDYAVPHALQQQMIQKNGTVKKVYSMNTSHLPFVANPTTFVQLLQTISQQP
jgi:pimeloyl-ACP methyl ester carboxylesterase